MGKEMDVVNRKGYVWPALDMHCHRVVFDTVVDMEPALALTSGRKVAVQAGGNCGVWANWLAARFEAVYTVEPDLNNYHCLVQNVLPNVNHARAAFGEFDGSMGLRIDARNIGAHSVVEDGDIPVLTIDSFKLHACDYVCLDVEGFEVPALKGASNTIRRCKPVIHIEDKGLSNQYGYAKGYAEEWLRNKFGYKVRHRINRDVILST